MVEGIINSSPTSLSLQKRRSPPRSHVHNSVNFAQYFDSRFGDFQFTREVENHVKLQSSVRGRSQGDLWSGVKACSSHVVVEIDKMEHFEIEFLALSDGESIKPKNCIAPFYLFIDKGAIKVAGILAH